MGVEVRVHLFFPLLMVVCLGLSSADGVLRGLGLFLVLVSAVAVRETARLLVAAWLGLRLRAILLLPIGGLFAYADPESQEGSVQGGGQFAMALAGPLANISTALVLAAAFLGASGEIKLVNYPWITAAYLLRSMVWMQAGLGLLHACCAAALPASTVSLSPAASPLGWVRRWRWRPWRAACTCGITGWSSPASSS
jgi:hypothetical protein